MQAGFTDIEVEPTRIYRVEDARDLLSGSGIDVHAIAPQAAIHVAKDIGLVGPALVGAFRQEITQIPEPTTLVLVSLSAAGLGAYAWRRRKRAAYWRKAALKALAVCAIAARVALVSARALSIMKSWNTPSYRTVVTSTPAARR